MTIAAEGLVVNRDLFREWLAEAQPRSWLVREVAELMVRGLFPKGLEAELRQRLLGEMGLPETLDCCLFSHECARIVAHNNEPADYPTFFEWCDETERSPYE